MSAGVCVWGGGREGRGTDGKEGGGCYLLAQEVNAAFFLVQF